MTLDPMTAGKAELEERDRVKGLAEDARIRLGRIDSDWRKWPLETAIDELLDIMSWGEALHALEYIDWEDANAVKETAFERRMREYRARTPGQRDPDR
jgi:hypothetical protein